MEDMTGNDTHGHGEPARLRQTPSWLIAQVATLTQRFVSSAYGAVGATQHQYAMLSALAEAGEATQAELGRHCNIDRSDVAGTVADLEREGSIERRENPLDRRQKLVSITAAGRARRTAIAESLTVAQDALLAGMSADERATLSALLVGVLDRHADAGRGPSASASKMGGARREDTP